MPLGWPPQLGPPLTRCTGSAAPRPSSRSVFQCGRLSASAATSAVVEPATPPAAPILRPLRPTQPPGSHGSSSHTAQSKGGSGASPPAAAAAMAGTQPNMAQQLAGPLVQLSGDDGSSQPVQLHPEQVGSSHWSREGRAGYHGRSADMQEASSDSSTGPARRALGLLPRPAAPVQRQQQEQQEQQQQQHSSTLRWPEQRPSAVGIDMVASGVLGGSHTAVDVSAASIPELLDMLAGRSSQTRTTPAPLHDPWGAPLRHTRPTSAGGYAWKAYPVLLKAQWRLEAPGYSCSDPEQVGEVMTLLMTHSRQARCLADLVELAERFPDHLTLPLATSILVSLGRLYPDGSLQAALAAATPALPRSSSHRAGSGTTGGVVSTTSSSSSSSSSSSTSRSSNSGSSRAAREGRRLTTLLRQVLGAAAQQVAAHVDRTTATPAAQRLLGRAGRLPGAGMALPELDRCLVPHQVAALAQAVGSLHLALGPAKPLAPLVARLVGLLLVVAWQQLEAFGACEAATLLTGLRCCGMLLPGSVVQAACSQQLGPEPRHGHHHDHSQQQQQQQQQQVLPAGLGSSTGVSNHDSAAGHQRWEAAVLQHMRPAARVQRRDHAPRPAAAWEGLVPGTRAAITQRLQQVLRRQVGQAQPRDLVLLLHTLSCHGIHPPATTWEAALAALAPGLQQPPPLSPKELAAAQQLEERYSQADACCRQLEERLAQLEGLKAPPPQGAHGRSTTPPAAVCVAGGELVPAHRLRRARHRLRRLLQEASMQRQQLRKELTQHLAPLATWPTWMEVQQQQQQQQQQLQEERLQQSNGSDSSGLLLATLLAVPGGASLFGLGAFSQESTQSQAGQAGRALTMAVPLDLLQRRRAAAAATLRPRQVALLLLAMGKAQHVPRSTCLQSALWSASLAAATCAAYTLPEVVAALRGAARTPLDPPPGWVAGHAAAAVGLLPGASLASVAMVAHSLAVLAAGGGLASVPPQLVVGWAALLAQAGVEQIPAAAAAASRYPPHRCRSHYALLLCCLGRLVGMLPRDVAADGRERLAPAACTMAGFCVRLLRWSNACDLVQFLEGVVRLGLQPPPALEEEYGAVLDKRLEQLGSGSLNSIRGMYRVLGWTPTSSFAKQLLLRL